MFSSLSLHKLIFSLLCFYFIYLFFLLVCLFVKELIFSLLVHELITLHLLRLYMSFIFSVSARCLSSLFVLFYLLFSVTTRVHLLCISTSLSSLFYLLLLLCLCSSLSSLLLSFSTPVHLLFMQGFILFPPFLYALVHHLISPPVNLLTISSLLYPLRAPINLRLRSPPVLRIAFLPADKPELY